MKTLLFVLAVSLSSSVFGGGYGYYYQNQDDKPNNYYGMPNSGTRYNSETGNSYNWNTNSYGTTQVNGYNTNTGSIWNTTIKSDGDMNGMDSKGHLWNYDEQSGIYMNYGTGELRLRGQKIGQ